MAWLNLAMPNQIVKNDLKAKMIKLPQIIFVSRKTTKKIFMYLLAPFILQNSKKTLRAYRVMRMCHFRDQNFLGIDHYSYFHLPIGPFHCAKFTKKSCSRSRVMRMCHFWAQDGQFTPNLFFGKLLISFSSTY